MKKLILLILCAATFAFADDAKRGPEQLVLAFMRDYMAWNDRSYLASKGNHSQAVNRKIESDYQALLRKYCRPDFSGEPIAYGSESSHDPAKEKIVSVSIASSSAVVATQHTGDTGFVADYEYQFVFTKGRWYLEQVYYVDEGKKYPGL